MNIIVSGRNTSVSESLKEYVDEKIGGAIEDFKNFTTSCDVVLRIEKNPSIANNNVCEVTVYTKGAVVRVSEAADEMHAAIDIASDKVTRQLRKYKTKLVDKRIKNVPAKKAVPLPDINEFYSAEEEDDLLVRVKEIEMEPMTEEHALVQIDLLGHDFYVYFDQDTHQIQVVYHRANGGYGIIKPVFK